MIEIVWSKIFISMGFITATGIVLSALLVFAEKKILNYGTCTVNINDNKKKLEVQGGSSLLSTLADNNIFVPSACGGRGSCGHCKTRVIEGGGMINPVEYAYITDDDVANNVRLACQVKVREDMSIAIPDELFNVKRFKARVVHKRPLTHDIIELKLELIEPKRIDFKAGQYVQLETEKYKGREGVSRAYSMSSLPSDNGMIELIIRKVPDGISTTWVFDILQEGDEVYFSGPYGKFHLSDTEAPMIFIAGGSGMAPIWSMIKHMKDKGIKRKAYYFFGATTQKDLFFADELYKMQDEIENFTFIPVLSNEPEDSDWKGERGFANAVVMKYIPDISKHEGYLCGGPGMINACVKSMNSGGITDDRIFYDKFA
ncbi:NADH:ubiquinone reductase (Na(+)-transporting) subunit F [Spirochaetota bacterium]